MQQIDNLVRNKPLWFRGFIRSIVLSIVLMVILTLFHWMFKGVVNNLSVISFLISVIVTGLLTHIGHSGGMAGGFCGIFLRERLIATLLFLALFGTSCIMMYVMFSAADMGQFTFIASCLAAIAAMSNIGIQDRIQNDFSPYRVSEERQFLDTVRVFCTLSIILNWFATYCLLASL